MWRKRLPPYTRVRFENRVSVARLYQKGALSTIVHPPRTEMAAGAGSATGPISDASRRRSAQLLRPARHRDEGEIAPARAPRVGRVRRSGSPVSLCCPTGDPLRLAVCPCSRRPKTRCGPIWHSIRFALVCVFRGCPADKADLDPPSGQGCEASRLPANVKNEPRGSFFPAHPIPSDLVSAFGNTYRDCSAPIFGIFPNLRGKKRPNAS